MAVLYVEFPNKVRILAEIKDKDTFLNSLKEANVSGSFIIEDTEGDVNWFFLNSASFMIVSDTKKSFKDFDEFKNGQ